jgi:hypothetical protein
MKTVKSKAKGVIISWVRRGIVSYLFMSAAAPGLLAVYAPGWQRLT